MNSCIFFASGKHFNYTPCLSLEKTNVIFHLFFKSKKWPLLIFEIQFTMPFCVCSGPTRNEKWSRSARNISTAFWHFFTCPRRLCICVVKPLSNFSQWWFVVFQRYLVIDVLFTVIFPWSAFCELLFNVFFKRLRNTFWVLCRAHFFMVF